jgi:hypothetical protein
MALCVPVSLSFWLHHPLNVGIRMPTPIRRRFNSRTTDTAGAATRHAVWGEAMRC